LKSTLLPDNFLFVLLSSLRSNSSCNLFSNYLNNLAFSTFLFLYQIKSGFSNESLMYCLTDSGENTGLSNFIPGFTNIFKSLSAYFNAKGLLSSSAIFNYFFKAFGSFLLI